MQWTLGAITGEADIYYRLSFTNTECSDDGVGVVDSGCRDGLQACDEEPRACVECTADGDCADPTPYCDPDTHTCEECIGSTQTVDPGCVDENPICRTDPVVNECVYAGVSGGYCNCRAVSRGRSGNAWSLLLVGLVGWLVVRRRSR